MDRGLFESIRIFFKDTVHVAVKMSSLTNSLHVHPLAIAALTQTQAGGSGIFKTASFALK
jgi:hypothetical protein